MLSCDRKTGSETWGRARGLGAALSKWRGDESGAILPLFGLSVLVVVGMVGLAVDSARLWSARSHLQSSVDAAILAVARQTALQPSADIEEVFGKYLAASKPEGTGITYQSSQVAKAGSVISATVQIDVQNYFMGLIGQDSSQVVVNSSAEFGIDNVELVMALDNTGSMAGAKIDSLKSAARSLVDQLENSAPDPSKIRIGLVPFAKYVNVGMEHRNAAWIDVPADYSERVPTYCEDTYPNAVKSNCRMVTGTCNNDGVPYSCSWEECDWDYGQPVNVCYPESSNAVTWSGCVYSRAYPLNVRDTDYSTRIPGKMGSSCSSKIVPLTTDMMTVRDAIDDMTANDKTYIPAGLMWGWRVLSSGQPFSEGQPVSPNVRKFLVLMTDGANTASPNSTGHDGPDITLSDLYTQEACANIKGAGITIFTVAFEVSDTTIKNILQTCASNTGYYFDATNSSALQQAFDAIGKLVMSLRLKS